MVKRKVLPFIKKTRYLLLLVLLALFAFLFFFFRKAKVQVLAASEELVVRRKGRGAFLFYDYVPTPLQGQLLEAGKVEDGERRKGGEALGPLSEEEKRELERSLAQEAGTVVGDYYQKMLDQGQALMPFSGLVTTTIDGYEDLLRPDMLEDLSPTDIPFQETGKREKRGLRFIDNRVFYLALDLPRRIHGQDWKIGGEYSLETDQGSRLSGRLESVHSLPSGEELLLFSLHDGLLQVVDQRFCSISLEVSYHKAFRIPISACFAEGSQTYCFIQDKDNLVTKVSLQVLEADLDQGEFLVEAEQKKGEENPYPTLSLYDRLILDPKNLEEGDLFQ